MGTDPVQGSIRPAIIERGLVAASGFKMVSEGGGLAFGRRSKTQFQ